LGWWPTILNSGTMSLWTHIATWLWDRSGGVMLTCAAMSPYDRAHWFCLVGPYAGPTVRPTITRVASGIGYVVFFSRCFVTITFVVLWCAVVFVIGSYRAELEQFICDEQVHCSVTILWVSSLFLVVWQVSLVRPVRLAYQPPASSTFLSEHTSHQYFSLTTNQPATSQTNTAV
jgi:hypothetical protein